MVVVDGNNLDNPSVKLRTLNENLKSYFPFSDFAHIFMSVEGF